MTEAKTDNVDLKAELNFLLALILSSQVSMGNNCKTEITKILTTPVYCFQTPYFP